MSLFNQPAMFPIYAIIMVAFIGINVLNRFFQIRTQQKAEAARKAEREAEKRERDEKRAARTSTLDGARRPAHCPASPANGQSLRAALINQGIIRPAVDDDDLNAGQHSDQNLQPAADPQFGGPAI